MQIMNLFTIEPPNTYTDAPHLRQNLLVGSLQLLGWFFFHPSAWRNYLASIEPALRPDFRFNELDEAQWQNPDIRRLLIMGYGILPLVAGAIAALFLWLLGANPSAIAMGVITSIIFGVGTGIASNFIIGTPVSLVSGLAVALGTGTGAGVALIVGSNRVEAPVEVAVVVEALVYGLGFGLFFWMSNRLIDDRRDMTAPNTRSYSTGQQLLGTALGIIVGGILLFTARLNANATDLNIGLISLVIGLLAGLIVWWGRDLLAGIVMTIGVMVAVNLAFFTQIEAVIAVILFAALAVIPYVLAERSSGPWLAAVATAVGGGGGWMLGTIFASEYPPRPILFVGLLGLLAGYPLFVWRPLLFYPFLSLWNAALHRADTRRPAGQPSLLKWHSAFWDEYQPFRFRGLDKHLLLVLERNPEEGQAALQYLATSPQRWAAQAAQIELEARTLARCDSAVAISQTHQGLGSGELEGPASALLRSFSRISKDVEAALWQETAYNQRLALSAVEDRLDSLVRELTRSSEPYATRFYPIAAQWQQILAQQSQALSEAVELRQEIDNPYIIGVPLTEQQEVFIGRTEISAQIEQLLLDRHSPPLLLYGQRRLGKTSLLNNLGRLLPSTIVPLFVDLQGPASWANDYAGFLYNLMRGMAESAKRQRNISLPHLPREKLDIDPFTYFVEWLDEVEQTLGDALALLALDEFEALDSALNKGRFDEEAVLGTLRHIIQHRPRFKILLAGSHSLDELQRWSSYLINAQVIHIGNLTETEAFQLIERPTRDFALRYEPAASQHLFSLTCGHPYLIQLLCAEVVALKNEQPPAERRLARLDDVEQAATEALTRGSLFFADIERNQIDETGQALLRFIAAQGPEGNVPQAALTDITQDLTELDQALTALVQRELIEESPTGYRFQVELIRRWFT